MQETLEKTRAMVHHLAAVNEILEKNGNDPSRLIPILQEVQEVYKYLSKDVISYVATSLDVPVAHVYGVATFYAHFSLNPKG
ncbi:MAG: NAD(P)H-dependent oxidoreductase subunit E, partial [Lentisphaeria bacterium]|nr:NAD(P)H-dependent oxidoreductase subunit E [Lentisphaeria bacterium]